MAKGNKTVASGGFNLNGITLSAAGSVSNPSITTQGDTSTGIYWPAPSQVGFTASGIERLSVLPGGILVTGSIRFHTSGFSSSLSAATDGQMVIADSSGAAWDMLQFGGTASTNCGLKVSGGTILETKLADNSGYAQHNAKFMGIVDGITAPTQTSGIAKLFVDTADGDLKIIFGDGTVKTIVVDT